MKAVISFLLAICLFTTPIYAALPLTDDAIVIDAPAACLMEQQTGTVIYEKDAHSRRHIASVTKVMTLLLIMEAIESGSLHWEDNITASANAASMGGSQIWLEEGETMTVREMVKCITVVSANDCSVAMAEHLSGTEQAFAQRMNERATQLGMADTHFTNCTGLFDEDEHYSCAYDVAVMARELISHEAIKEFSTIWMDTARDGEFGLSNTNKLIYYYDGATGLKTGFTDGAKYCLAATAEREGTQYVASILGADTSNHRFDSAKTLLSFGFANFTVCDLSASVPLPRIPVELGKQSHVMPSYGEGTVTLLEKNTAQGLRFVPELAEKLDAPVTAGQHLGSVKVYSGETLLQELPVTAGETVERMTTWDIFLVLVNVMLGKEVPAAPTDTP